MQLICSMNQIFRSNRLKLKLSPYEILATSHDCGLIEFVSDALSVDYIRRAMALRYNRTCDLFDFFRKNFGGIRSKTFVQA